MTRIDRYLEDIAQRLYASPAERDRFTEDLRAHLAEGQERGESVESLIAALGLPQDIAAAFNAERQVLHAGFWLRSLAFLGDCGVLGLLCLPFVALILVMLAFGGGEVSAPGFVLVCLLGIGAFGMAMAYFPLLEARFGRTAGKWALGLRVVREDLGPISLGQALIRRLSFFFEFLVIDALFVPFTRDKQRALDVVARTLVIREPERPVPPFGVVLCLAAPFAACCSFLTLALVCGSFT